MPVKSKSDIVHEVDNLLSSVALAESGAEKDRVVYGVTDVSLRSFWRRIDDYLVDGARVPIDEKAYFFHLMAVMLDAGLPILKALKVLALRTSSHRFRRVINTLAYNVENGKTLSDSLSKFPDIFNESEIGVVRSGEAVGHLDRMLFKLSDQLEKDRDLSHRITNMLWYPGIVLTVLLVVAAIIIVFVIPTLTDFFAASGVELPLLTRFFIGFSAFLGDFWWLLLLVLVACYAIFTAYVRSDYGRFKWDYAKLTLPVVGNIVRKTLIARFVLLLSVLVEAGLPINRSLEIIAGAMGNDVYRRKILQVKERVEAGERISDNLGHASLLFPDTVVNMLTIGETSASLGMIADKLAAHYLREVDSTVKRATTVFEPVVLLMVALFVALLAVSILQPLFSFGETI